MCYKERWIAAILHNGVIVQKVNECAITTRYVNIALDSFII